MEQWRQLVAGRESDLRRARTHELDDSAWVPAYLTSWVSSAPSAEGSGADESLADDGAEVGAAAGGSSADDESFVYEWQLHAEQKRRAADAAAEAVPLRPSFLQTVRMKREREFERSGLGKAGAGEHVTIGIDLGTTNCAIAAVRGGKPTILPSRDGRRVSPSVVSYVAKGGAPRSPQGQPPLLAPGGDARVVVGEGARRLAVTNRQSTYASTKRLIGRTSTAEELRRLMALDVPHRVAGRDVLLACPALSRAISPLDCAAELVRELIEQARQQLALPVSRAVVTVPAYFDEAQRAATETACLLAGLSEVSLLREPEAAALLYALDKRSDERVMVFDLGGGTFDVSIVDVGGGVVEVVATSGDPRLGGDDWDGAVAQWLEDRFVEAHGVALDAFGRWRLRDAAEEAKLGLSEATSVVVDVPFLQGSLGLNVTLSRRKFEAITRSLVLRLVPPMLEVASMAGIEWNDESMGTLAKGAISNAPSQVRAWQQQAAWRWQRLARKANLDGLQRFPAGVPVSRVVLVGGATRMPMIGRFIKRITGLDAKPTVDPEEAVALGAAAQAAILDGRLDHRVFNPYFSTKPDLDAAEIGGGGARAAAGLRTKKATSEFSP